MRIQSCATLKNFNVVNLKISRPDSFTIAGTTCQSSTKCHHPRNPRGNSLDSGAKSKCAAFAVHCRERQL